jgi:hypothetical protein
VLEAFVQELLESISVQSTMPDEVIISGAHKPYYLSVLLPAYNKKFPVKFLVNNSVSTSSNLNFVMQKSESTITKILFHDDFFISKNAIKRIHSKFRKPSTIWSVETSKNFNNDSKKFEKKTTPRIASGLADGINSVGSPSVIAIRTKNYLPFNEELKWLLDCEWYLRMFHHFGNPTVIRRPQIASRLHSGQATHWAKSLQDPESELVKEIHIQNNILKKFSFGSSETKCSCIGGVNEA